MLKRNIFYLLSVLTLSVLLFTSCANDVMSDSENSKNGGTRYTVIIYGMNGGSLDNTFDGAMHDIQTVLGDDDEVRVLLVYKYGGAAKSVGTLAYPGQLLYFELTKDTDLSKLKDSSAIVDDSIKLYDPEYITSVINYAHDKLPAQEYLLFVEGHGLGFDFEADFPKSERANALAKRSSIASLMTDELDPFGHAVAEQMTMNELAKGIRRSKVRHFKAILFHNCLMGNVESLDEIYSYADYIMVSEHTFLTKRGEVMTEVVESLVENVDGDFENVVKTAFENKDFNVPFRVGYDGEGQNGDYQFVRADKISALDPIFKKLAKRLIELYGDKKYRSAIDRAADKTYKIRFDKDLYDARDYANKLAEETKDKTLKNIAKELDEAFDSMAITRAMESHVLEDAPLDHYTFSIVLVDSETYNGILRYPFGATNRDSYEYTTFHENTGWGDWLNTNTHTPTGNPCGEIDLSEE